VGTNIGSANSGLKPASYQPPTAIPSAGTASGIPGASYPVLGSTPVTNMQPRYGQPGRAMTGQPGGGLPPQNPPPMNGGGPVGNTTPQSPGMNPQNLASILGRLGGGMR
jgi:hypothetical protein